MGEHGDARGRDRRPPPRRGARRPLPRDEAGAARVGAELLDQGGREALRLRAHGRGRRRGRVGQRLRDVARDRGRLAARRDPRLQPGGLRLALRAAPLAARAAAGGTSLAAAAGGARARARRRRSGDAERDARPRRAPRRRRGGRPALAPRAPPRLPPARGAAAVVGVLLPPRTRRRGAPRRTATRSAGSSSTASRTVEAVLVEYPFTFPPQEHKIHGRASTRRPSAGSTSASTTSTGRVQLRWGREQADEPLPRALIPPKPLVREGAARGAPALRREAGSGTRPLVEILERRPPRARLDGTLTEAALSLDGSYLFVQGPPGSGKTWNGARMAARAHAGRPARRRDGAEPQGDPQVPRGRRGGGASRTASSSAG